ncbi:MAG: NAD(P)H-quinone oxidoreductase subunit F [Pseudanabaenaceae cyanobacterium SKYGB_i_bin29]|nr:NAD(P)H-quinone oxidoreductase subunit F [Pseudanabaenaceae cyanobacterium SKYG29]MDW8421074.1 NAD(P)H-quinone oxidoreductase subunit F [Pseudanabaenaceae cyanobacterium SKYGB_i_bin29]
MQGWIDTIWLVPIYSLVGAGLSLIWSPAVTRRTGPRPAGYVNILMTLLAWLHSTIALVGIWGKPSQFFAFPWFSVAGLDFTFDIEVSPVTIGAMVVVTGINLLAQIYAVGYMEMDWAWARFYALLAFFEAGMCALSLCDSLFFSYVILEILTLGTYLLVGMWYNQSLVVTGARDAFLTKRVGDLLLLMGVVSLFPLTGTWNFHLLADWAAKAQVNPVLITLVLLGLIAGPMGKCAQFPLHLWLDEAMEGPLPSTILRNGVVVLTGAWVLAKIHPLLELSVVAQQVTIAVGAATALGTVLIEIGQIDAKRALSYLVSTYMGLIFIAVGTGSMESAYLLMLSNSLGASLLVMALGSIISNNITQDLTLLGGLWTRRPISGLSFLVGIVGLGALPPFCGFWGLASLFQSLQAIRPGLATLVLVINGLLVFGLVRVFGLVWGGKPKQMTERSVEPLWLMVLPMTVGAGIVLHTPQLLTVMGLIKWTELPTSWPLILSSLVGVLAGSYIYLNDGISKPIVLPNRTVQDFFTYDFYTPQLYKLTIVGLVDIFSRLMYWFDRFFVDGLGNLFGIATILSGESLKYSTFGQFQLYVLTMLVGVALLVFLVFNS